MSDQWEQKTFLATIGKGALFSDGDWIESKDQDQNGGVRLVQLADILDGEFKQKSERFMTHQRSDELRTTNLEKGDLLIARMPDPIGRSCIFPGAVQDCVTVVDVAIARPTQCHPQWLMYYLNSQAVRAEIEERATGTTRKRISRSALSEMLLQVPPLPEQKKIAEILSGIDKSISTNCQKITALETLYTSLLADSLKKLPGDCHEIQLADACSEVFLGLTSKVDYVENEGVPLVRASDIKNGIIDFNATRSISKDQHLSLTRYRKAEKGDVLVTKSGSLGECAIVHTEKEFSIYESIVCLKPRSDLLSTEYLFHAMQSRAVKDQFLSGKVGSAVAHLNLNDFRKITLLLPSLDAQKVISKTLDALQSNKDHLKADTNKKIYLKSAISLDLLTGHKRVSV